MRLSSRASASVRWLMVPLALWLWLFAACKSRSDLRRDSPGPESKDTAAAVLDRLDQVEGQGQKTVEYEKAAGFLKGQLHAHTGRSGDSQTPPDDVVRWYTEHGFDFIVLTDHNVITRHLGAGQMLVFPGVEITQNLRRCDPPPEPGMACLLHINALMLDDTETQVVDLRPPVGGKRLDIYQQALDASARLGGIAQLNHPNFHYSADAALIAELGRRGLLLLEVANEAFDSNNQGDADHVDTETLWDQVLGQGVTVWAVATDDAHHYYDAERARARGEDVFTGDRGFVMVRAERSGQAIEAALRRGDFYSSSGVLLRQVATIDSALEVEVASESPHEFRFIGPGGVELARSRGLRARYSLAGTKHAYVRAVVENRVGARAWTQPVMRTRARR